MGKGKEGQKKREKSGEKVEGREKREKERKFSEFAPSGKFFLDVL